VTRVLASIALLVFTLGGCATAPPKEDTVVLVEPNLPLSGADVPGNTPADPPPAASVLSEPIAPVRGGDRVLPPYRGPDPCRMALRGESPVARACSDGGQRRAMELMQSFVKRAKAEGITFVCTDCHVDEDDYTKLTPRADGEFRKLLFLARPE
jgi:hypothetical protein